MLNSRALPTVSLLLSLALSAAPFTASANDKQAFNAAYIKYQTTVKQGNWSAALTHAQTAYNAGKALYSDAPETMAELSANYGTALLQNGQHKVAILKFEEALSVFEASYGEDAPELASVLMNLADAKAKQTGSAANSMALMNRAQTIAKTEFGNKSATHAEYLLRTGTILLDANEAKLAASALEKAEKYYTKDLGEASYEVAKTQFQRARLQLQLNQKSKARKLFEQSIATLELRGQADNTLVKRAQSYLVDIDNNFNAIASGD